jgi:hypothetical protein
MMSPPPTNPQPVEEVCTSHTVSGQEAGHLSKYDASNDYGKVIAQFDRLQ